MKYVEVTAINGVRNDVGPERFAPGDLVYARNVDIDESGKAKRRAGTALVVAGAAHSAWSDGSLGYLVQGGMLKTFTSGGVMTDVTPVAGSRVRYTLINGEVYWTDGISSGIINAGVNRPWGITPPASVTASDIFGTLPQGTYLITMTFVDSSGKESGAPLATSFTCSSGGIELTNLPVSTHPMVVGRNLYISEVNGDLPMLAAELDNTVTTYTYRSPTPRTIPVRNSFVAPPPAGTVLGYHNGRAYVANGPFLFYSLPFEYESFDMRNGFVAFDSDIQTFIAVSGGIYVGTATRTVFLAGSNPEEFTVRPISPFGTILGTELVVSGDAIAPSEGKPEGWPAEAAVMWMSKRGLVVGDSSGVAKDLTARKYVLPAASHGAALFKRRDATPQYLVSLFS